MSILEKAIIIDLDGTLANVDHRINHIKDGGRDWSKFFQGISKDTLQDWCKMIMDELFMRPIKDYRPDNIIKREIYEKEIKNKYEVVFVIDDRAQVVEMWRSIGLVCLQCAPGDF